MNNDTPADAITPCRYCGDQKRFQIVSPVSDHAWADCFCVKDRATSLAAQDVDSGMSGDAVERAEWFWANLPTGRKWAGLATHEKALVCHQIARIAPSLAAQDGLVERIDRAIERETLNLPLKASDVTINVLKDCLSAMGDKS